MQRMMVAVLLVVAAGFVDSTGAQEDASRRPAAPKVDKADAGGAKMAEAKSGTQTKIGTLAAKPLNAPDGVLAVLRVPSESGQREGAAKGKRLGKGAAEKKEDTFDLMAAGAEMAVKIKELTAKEAYVEVTGTVDGEVMRVSSVKEVPKSVEAKKDRDSKAPRVNRRKADPQQ